MIEQTAQMAPPGWYRPQGEEGERYWDGTQWTDQRRPVTEAEIHPRPAEAAYTEPASIESTTAKPVGAEPPLAQVEAVEPLFAQESEGPAAGPGPAGPGAIVTIAPDAPVSTTVSDAATAASVPEPAKTGVTFNAVTEVRFRRGWPGIFAGENQTKALNRAIAAVNASGLAVVATASDRWSFWHHLGSVLVAVVTLGFVVRAPNLLLITAPMASGQVGQPSLDHLTITTGLSPKVG